MDDAIPTVPAAAGRPALHLRPWTADDLPEVLEVHRDPVMRRWSDRVLATADDAERWLAAETAGRAAGTRLGFAVCDAETGRLLGNVVLKGGGPGEPSAEVGYWTAPAARGRGVASRAVDAVVAWAAARDRDVPLERVELIHSVGNDASCRVSEKSGFPLDSPLPPHPPKWPNPGHLHVRVLRPPTPPA